MGWRIVLLSCGRQHISQSAYARQRIWAKNRAKTAQKRTLADIRKRLTVSKSLFVICLFSEVFRD